MSAVSIVVYCDYIILASPTSGHLELLLNECFSYAKFWKLEFNAPKSAHVEFGKYKTNRLVKLSDVLVPKYEKIMYLGLPIGDKETKYDFLESRFRKLGEESREVVLFFVWFRM